MLRAVADALPASRLAGFVTEEIRVRGERRGFALVTFDGRREVMAHVARAGAPRVGKYGVDVEVLETVARTALAPRPRAVYLVDEIGKMECLSPAFVAVTRALLDAGVPLVATVGRRGGGFVAAVKRRPRRHAVGNHARQSRRDAGPRARLAAIPRADHACDGPAESSKRTGVRPRKKSKSQPSFAWSTWSRKSRP